MFFKWPCCLPCRRAHWDWCICAPQESCEWWGEASAGKAQEKSYQWPHRQLYLCKVSTYVIKVVMASNRQGRQCVAAAVIIVVLKGRHVFVFRWLYNYFTYLWGILGWKNVHNMTKFHFLLGDILCCEQRFGLAANQSVGSDGLRSGSFNETALAIAVSSVRWSASLGLITYGWPV